MNDHHDPELCRRLAENVMGWKYLRLDTFDTPLFKHGPKRNDNRHFDPCCHPAHWWLLVQKMAEIGHDIHNEYDSLHKGWFVQIWVHGSPRPVFDGTRYRSLLHSTALSADEVTK